MLFFIGIVVCFSTLKCHINYIKSCICMFAFIFNINLGIRTLVLPYINVAVAGKTGHVARPGPATAPGAYGPPTMPAGVRPAQRRTC
jgi:hypothetical protein